VKKLLHIVATPLAGESGISKVVESFFEEFSETHPDWVVEELDLTREDKISWNAEQIDDKSLLSQDKELSEETSSGWQDIIQHMEKFFSADAYLVSTPMWNFSFPYLLKRYLYVIVQPQYLFEYTKAGSQSLAKNRKMLVLISQGGDRDGPGTLAFDEQEPYLSNVFKYIGIRDIQFITTHPGEKPEALRAENIKKAQKIVKELVKQF